MHHYKEDFISNLKYYRDKKGYSQAKLAELCNCQPGTIGCIECGRQFPSFDLLFKISDVLEIHPADLLLRDASQSTENLKNHIENILTKGIAELLETEFNKTQ